MKEENLIIKWLDHDLTMEELKVLEGSEDFQTLKHISDIAAELKTPHFDAETALASINVKKKTTDRSFNFTTLVKIAAVLLIALGLFYYTTTLDTTVYTPLAKTEQISLPDDSSVVINADSKLKFNKNSWKENRNLTLDGEAYFKVAKGKKFTVTTLGGEVSVLGTEFNVRYRDKKLVVTCFEGAVKVTSGANSIILKPTHKVVIENKEISKQFLEQEEIPTWVKGESTFVSLPFIEVIRELERQYDVTVETNNINTSTLFTGGFKHHDITMALQTITSPMQLTFTKKGKKIILSSE